MLENRQDEEKQNKITQMKMRPPTNNWTSFISVLDRIIKRARVGIPFTGLSPHIFVSGVDFYRYCVLVGLY
jgi:hypothetical protein